MTERSPFGIRLWRLVASRRLTFQRSFEQMVDVLACKSGVPHTQLDEVIDGSAPGPDVLRALGPALGIHTADMFVLAGLPVPDDEASAWPTAPRDVGQIVRTAVALSPTQLGRLDELVRSLPAQPRLESVPVRADDYPEGPGALLLRLLRNRNIRPHNALILLTVGGGPYVSHSTVAMLGPGNVVITPQYVTAFAHLLGYAPEDMVALTGVGPVADTRVHEASAQIATLAWNARRLSGDQIRHVEAAAERMVKAERSGSADGPPAR